MKKVLLPLLLIIAAFPLTGQEVVPDNETNNGLVTTTETAPVDSGTGQIPSPPPSDDKQIYIIAGFEFDITGRTRPDALIYNGELKQGEIIEGYKNLLKYIAGKQQLFINQRVLKDTVMITHVIGEQQEDGAYPVTLYIRTEDTWNIIALPYPKYSSNSGFELSVKARDYNFLGTMNPLRVDLTYEYDEEQRSSLGFDVLSDTPFKAFGYNWNFRFDHSFKYRADEEEQYYYKNLTGLSVELPYKRTTFTVGFEETSVLNDENAGIYELLYGKFQSGLYMISRPFAMWKIPTGLEVSDYGELTWTPSIAASFPHEFPEWPLLDIRKGPTMDFGHILGFGRIDWIGNYRKGFDVSFSNSYIYNFYNMRHDKEALSVSYSVTGTGHFIVNDFIGISARLNYRHWFSHDPGYYDNAGDVLRGILDDRVRADYMLSLNLDMPIRVFRFLPSQWFNAPKLRLFDFDLHVSPILDLALFHDPVDNITFDIINMIYCGGLEFIAFPNIMRSLYIRASFAVRHVEHIPLASIISGGSKYELFIGVGHHY